MNFSSKPLIFFLAFITITSSVIYLSCNKDPKVETTTKKKCVTCVNGGQCINDTCRCPSGYEGFSCEELSITKFTGSWKVAKNGVQSFSTYISSASVDIVYIDYFENSYDIYGKISGDTITIPGDWHSNTYIIGKGIIHNDPLVAGQKAITFRYSINDTFYHIVQDYGYNDPTTQPTEWTRL